MLGCRKEDMHFFADYDSSAIELYRSVIKEEPTIHMASEFISKLSKLGTYAVDELHKNNLTYRQILKYGKKTIGE